MTDDLRSELVDRETKIRFPVPFRGLIYMPRGVEGTKGKTRSTAIANKITSTYYGESIDSPVDY